MNNPNDCVVFLADPQTFRDITRPRAPYYHDLKANKMFLELLGTNMVVLEGEEWKRHRRIAQRAFNENLPQLIWTETMLALDEAYDLWDLHHGQRVNLPQVAQMTKTLALMVIAAAALGKRLSWIEDQEQPEPGFTMSFQTAAKTVAEGVVTRALLPTWAEGATQTTRTVVTGYKEFKKYIQQMMDTRRREGVQFESITDGGLDRKQPDADLFSVLLAASDEDAKQEGKGLTDDEVIGNTFFLMFAGHETSANTLAFALGMLAVHSDVQQEVYNEIKQVMGSRSRLEYSDMDQLKLVFGTFLESLRMYPVVPQNVRVPSEDSILSVARNGPNADSNERENLFVPANSYIFISMVGIHYNPKYWPEPEEFRPSRFIGPYNKDALVTFSVGRRTCIGQKQVV
ncbi:hypothetical protein FRC09_000369 [Ceratobasidium sp. 395]|nr:hypothetical protein FRC09_000369 [Ceratobasidium sp. 395]